MTEVPINMKGDVRLIEELQTVLLCARNLPAFRRGRMYFDYKANKVRIAPAPGSDA